MSVIMVMMTMMVMAVIVAVIVTMIMPAAARITMLVVMMVMMMVVVMVVIMVVMIARHEGGRELVFDSGRLLTAATRILDGERHDLGREANVIGMPEVVTPEPAGTIEHEQRRRALHLVGRECLRRAFSVRLVDPDREGPLVLVLEDLKCFLGHHLVMLKNRVQGDDGNLIGAEALAEPSRLRQALRHTARAQHLKGHQHHYLALETGQGHRFV